MKKNIKKILIVITLFISTMLFTNKVDAVVMYKQCTYNSVCEQYGQSWCSSSLFTFCIPELNTYVSITDNTGSVEYRVKHSNKDKLYDLEDEYGGKGCWLKEIDGSCSEDSDRYSSSPTDIFYDNSCPSGITTQGGFQVSRIGELASCFGIMGKIITWIKTGNLCYWNAVCNWETWQDWEYVPFGTDGSVVESSSIDKVEYAFYSIDLDGKTIVLGEGYSENGEYSYVGPNFVKFWSDEITNYQLKQISRLKSDFWKVHENFESRLIAVGKGVSVQGLNVCNNGEDACKRDYNYKLLYTSADISLLTPEVAEWYNDNVKNFEKLEDITNLANKETFINVSEELNEKMLDGKAITFNKYKYNGKDYVQEDLITDLELAYLALDKAYPEDENEYGFLDYGYLEDNKTIFTSPQTSLTSYIMVKKLGVKQIRDLQFDDDAKEYSLNPGILVSGLKRDASEALKKYMQSNSDNINILDVSDSLDEYIKLFYTTTAYLNSNSVSFHLTTEQVTRVKELMAKYEKLAERIGLEFYPVVDCESLLGEELIEKIKSYTNIIKIAVPIIVIGLGIIDFTKAIFAGIEDMKKAEKSFIKRILIAVLIFLTPTIVNLILQLANKVWLTISPNSCGIF